MPLSYAPSSRTRKLPHHSRQDQHRRLRWRRIVVAAWLLVGVCVALGLYCLGSREPAIPLGVQPEFDVVGMNLKPSCVTRISITALNQHLKPRHIYVITPKVQACEKLKDWAANVRCVDENTLVPGVTSQWISRELQRLYPQLRVHKFEKGRTPAGWYFQQIMKLAVARALPQLSDYFVIWDFDMVPVQPIPLLYSPRGVYDHDLRSGRNVMTVVNIGGAMSKGYASTYEALFHAKLEHAPDGSSFVTHWLVVRKDLMLAFLDAMSSSSARLSWIANILEHLPADDLFMGFSEYASYVSWVKQNHPETQHIKRRKTWLRQPVGGDWGVWAAQRLHKDGLCCPSHMQLALHRALGYQYTGFEIGHHPACKWTDPRFEVSYGL